MTDMRTSSQIALDIIERKIFEAKKDAKVFDQKGLPVPDYIRRRIKNLKEAALELRELKSEESR